MKKTIYLKNIAVTLAFATCLANLAIAAEPGSYYSEYLDRYATSQEEAQAIAADRKVQKKPVALKAAGSKKRLIYSEYLTRKASTQEESQAIAADREIQRKPAVISAAGSGKRLIYSEYLDRKASLQEEIQAITADLETQKETNDNKPSL